MICHKCGIEFEPTSKRQKVCTRSCHLVEVRKQKSQERKDANLKAIQAYERKVLPFGSKLVALRDFLHTTDRMIFSSMVRKLKLKKHMGTKKIRFHMKDEIQQRRIKVQYTNLDQIADIIRAKEEVYLVNPRLDFKRSMNHYLKVASYLEAHLRTSKV